MLSILIPIYNQLVEQLVKDLHLQLSAENIDFEIILSDDASDEDIHQKNNQLVEYQNVIYFHHEQNLGRAKSRNFLAEQAKYPYLIMIDCDAAVVNMQYIRRYLQEIEKQQENENFVLLGGVAYHQNPPEHDFYLRWKYGKAREEVAPEIRNEQPYRSFTPFNVLITKSLFNIICFDESLVKYGNEDTLFGIELKKHQIKTIHIDNPLYHDGLDMNALFFQKIKTGIENLVQLLNDGKIDNNFIEENKLLSVHLFLKNAHLLPLILLFYDLFKSYIEKRILKRFNLQLLDYYKLGYFEELKNTK